MLWTPGLRNRRMARFAEAITVVLEHEGGYVDHKDDRGGATNWGISSRFLREIGDTRHPRELTRADAVDLYRRHFWNAGRFAYIDDQTIATKVFDLAVNVGVNRAGVLVQRACRAHGHELLEDGIVGPKTRAAIAACRPLEALRSEAAGHYRAIVASRRSQSVFLRGWLRRAYS